VAPHVGERFVLVVEDDPELRALLRDALVGALERLEHAATPTTDDARPCD